MNKGITLVELMVAIGILMIIFAIGMLMFGRMERDSEIDEIASEIKATLQKSQALCLNNIPSGVYFETDKYTLFYGSSYNANNPKNEIYNLPGTIRLTDIHLPSPPLTNSVTFDKITGYITNYADPTNLTIRATSGRQKIMTLNKFGTIEI